MCFFLKVPLFPPLLLFREKRASHRSFPFHQWQCDFLLEEAVQVLAPLAGLPVIVLLVRRLYLAC